MYSATRQPTEVSRRLAAISESATIRVESKARALAATGRSVISFGTGEPDFPTADFIVEAAIRAARDPRNHHYSPSSGLPALREAIAEKTLRDSAIAVDPSQIIVTNGGKQAVYEALATLVNEGDEVLLPAPYWTTYPESIALAGGVAVEVFADAGQEYKVTVEQLDDALTERSTGIIFVSPSNPTGSVYSRDEIHAIGQWALERGLWVVTDEIYQNLTYDGVASASLSAVVPELEAQTILANGVAKTYAMTGWRVGWLVAPPKMAGAAGNLQSHLSSNVSNIAQLAALAALTGPQDEAERMRGEFAKRRDLILGQLRTIEGIVTPTPQGAFYVYPDVRAMLGRTWYGTFCETSSDLAEVLLDHAGVATVPGEAFGPSGYLRFSYALDEAALLEGLGRVREFFSGD